MVRKIQNLLKKVALSGVLALAAVTGADAQYCTPANYYGCSWDYINNFSTTGGFTNITNNGSSCAGPYTYFSTKTHTGVQGTPINFSVYAEYQYVYIYADWNIDGDFNDAGELVYTTGYLSYPTYSTTGSFNIPATATPGTTRMRVRCYYSTPVPACGYTYYGEAEDYNLVVYSPCPGPTSVSATPFAKTANISWPAVSGSLGYEYVVDQTAGTPTGTIVTVGTGTTSATVTGLTPGTAYYAHVRSKCTTNPSEWKVQPFTTSTCVAPTVSFANITHNSATALWQSINIASNYNYVFTTDPNPPASTAPFITTTVNNVQFNNLLAATNYYIHIRSKCTNGEISSWDTYQLTTMNECTAPQVTVIPNGNNRDLTWVPVANAVAYEYAVNASATPPSLGGTVYQNDMSLALPADNNGYYFHIRSKCISIFNTSDWATVTLREAPVTSVTNVNASDAQISVYPNPVKDVVTIKLNSSDLSGAIQISDVTGKVVFAKNVTSSTMDVNMNSMTSGIYVVKYTDRNQNTQVIKITKQ